MERSAFAHGMALLQAVAQVDVDDYMTEAWWTALKDLTDEQWDLAVKRTLRIRTTYGRMPEPGLIRGQLEMDATEASALFEKVWASRVVTANGTWWAARKVERECGAVAFAAFQRLGGSDAFERGLRDPIVVNRLKREFAEAVGKVQSEGLVKAHADSSLR